jgi:hypothetical protein
MRKVCFYILLVFILSSCGVAHTLKKAEEYLAVGEYYDAGNQYKKAFRMIPAKERSKRGEIALKQARCYAKINQSVRAASAYANAVRYGKADKNDMLNYARQLLKQGKYKDCEPEFPATRVDTTAAGDNFAAGFIYGLVNNWSLDRCVKAGNVIAGNVIEVVGATMDEKRWTRIKNEIAKI